ncbi:putative membrane protein [Paucimonas lemoignei]|uniref:Putative membrane protein n=1 Tax=Paucimonas lemoignei TaxID=29443 RepID=A0A4R3HXM7_PAULE|nr:bestrophin family ion channel [Paucimonas lemoignei]TCS37373.1 putative membrane protein [Paucimonas lemoignei]
MIIRDRPSGLRLFFILKGSILPHVVGVLSANIIVAIIVTVFHGSFSNLKITLTPIPFTLIGLALAIFLGFRNTAAYDRFWEGRKLWGQLVYGSRNLARECLSLISATEPANFKTGLQDVRIRIIYRAIAFAHTLRQTLRESGDLSELKEYLLEEDWRQLGKPAGNLNLLMLQMGRDVRLCLEQGRIDGPIATAIDSTLSSMAAVAASCERIKNTPIPFSYSLLLHRTAYLYCFLLPFGLVDTTGFMTPVVVAIVAYTFFGLDALGDEIEEPFGTSDNDLPLDAICRTIESDLRKAVGDPDTPPPLMPIDYCLR